MKLNNHGWGYRDMIIWTTVMILLLIFVGIQISSLYDEIQKGSEKKTTVNTEVNNENNNTVIVGGEDDDDDDKYQESVNYSYYARKEQEMTNAAYMYLGVYNYDLSNQIMEISLDTLVNLGYIEKVYDQFGDDTCDGYVNVYKDASIGENVAKPSIICSNYKTE